MKSKIRKKIIQNEFEVLKETSHPKIIKFYQRFETKTQIHLIMEYFRGQGLDCFLKRFLQRKVPQKMAKPILKQVLHGLQYLHENNVYHRGGDYILILGSILDLIKRLSKKAFGVKAARNNLSLRKFLQIWNETEYLKERV